MSWIKEQNTKKKILLYFCVFYSLAVVGLLLLKVYSRKSFSKARLDQLISGNGSRDISADDPCHQSIVGEPTAVGTSFVKIFFHCPGGRVATNMLSLAAIKGTTLKFAIGEVGRINGFEANIDSDKIISLGPLVDSPNLYWTCIADSRFVHDFNLPLHDAQQVDCYYAGEVKL